jgi:hypothetical protein
MSHTENNEVYFSITPVPALTKSFLYDLKPSSGVSENQRVGNLWPTL